MQLRCTRRTCARQRSLQAAGKGHFYVQIASQCIMMPTCLDIIVDGLDLTAKY